MLHFARVSGILRSSFNSERNKKTVTRVLNSNKCYFSPKVNTILPLIYRNIIGQSGIGSQLRPNVLKKLKDNTLQMIAVDMINRQWLINTLELFRKKNIPVILLKGVAFAGNLYPENAPRLGVDIDLLVKNDDFETACNILCKTMNPVLLDSTRIATHESLFERVFLPKKGVQPTVEVHRGLTNPSIFNIDQDSLWGASSRHPAFDSELVRILSPEDTLLHLAVHAFRDLDFCTHNLLDAHEIWCQWHPDESRLAERAKQWGAEKVLFYLLVNCKVIMETPVPDKLLENLKPNFISNSINIKILQSTALNNPLDKPFYYRFTQLISQISFPDHIWRGLKFQLSYARTRIDDWVK